MFFREYKIATQTHMALCILGEDNKGITWIVAIKEKPGLLPFIFMLRAHIHEIETHKKHI